MDNKVYISNNRTKPSIRYNNRHYLWKHQGRSTVQFRCAGHKCYASLSLHYDAATEHIDSNRIYSNNAQHADGCLIKTEAFFETRNFVKSVREQILQNPTQPLQQLYETQRAVLRTNSNTCMPDYSEVKSGLKKRRAKVHVVQQYDTAENLIVHDKFTSNGTDPFLIYDNHKHNRILGWCSKVGLQMLAKSKYHHADGTFHTRSRYFGQLYVIHSFFEPCEYDPAVDKVWVKRMIPCAWFFMKRRRTKDYVQVLGSLIDAANKYNLKLQPTPVIYD